MGNLVLKLNSVAAIKAADAVFDTSEGQKIQTQLDKLATEVREIASKRYTKEAVKEQLAEDKQKREEEDAAKEQMEKEKLDELLKSKKVNGSYNFEEIKNDTALLNHINMNHSNIYKDYNAWQRDKEKEIQAKNIEDSKTKELQKNAEIENMRLTCLEKEKSLGNNIDEIKKDLKEEKEKTKELERDNKKLKKEIENLNKSNIEHVEQKNKFELKFTELQKNYERCSGERPPTKVEAEEIRKFIDKVKDTTTVLEKNYLENINNLSKNTKEDLTKRNTFLNELKKELEIQKFTFQREIEASDLDHEISKKLINRINTAIDDGIQKYKKEIKEV